MELVTLEETARVVNKTVHNIRDYIQRGRIAYMNDTFVLECISVLSRDENDHNPTWQVLSGEDLRALRENPILHRREWYPRDLFGVKQYPFSGGSNKN